MKKCINTKHPLTDRAFPVTDDAFSASQRPPVAAINESVKQQRVRVARARIEITASRSLCVTLRLTTDDGDDDGALRNTALFRRTALAYTRGDGDGDDVA